jgi:hypothetical protein
MMMTVCSAALLCLRHRPTDSSVELMSAPPTYWQFSRTDVSAPPTYWQLRWNDVSTSPAVNVCHLNFSVCATSLLIFQLNSSVWSGLLTVCQLNCSVWIGLLTVCQLNFSVRATGLLNLWTAELLPSRDISVFEFLHITTWTLVRLFLLGLYFAPQYPFTHSINLDTADSVNYPTWFLVLLAWTKTLSSQEAIRVIKCLHAG